VTIFQLKGIEDTKRLALCISKVVRPGDVILLSGDLGAGKTTLTRFLAQGLGIDQREVTSPTFNLIHEYLDGDLPLIHADLYRLGEGSDIFDMGLEDYLNNENILIVEWSNFLSGPISSEFLEIRLAIEESERTAIIDSKGSGWIERIRKIEGCFEKGEP